jgi:gentisate 1,2-dioxygenase
MSAVPKPANQAERQNFYQRIDARNVTPLWEVLHGLIMKEPRPAAQPYLWNWAQMRPWLLESAGLISAEEAERRVLVLENPGLRGKSRITNSLYAGLQLIMPGEVAPAHRHSQSALRFVVDGHGAYTAVDGERVFMSPGDFIITPSWTYHDHGNPGKDPVIWLDGLDVPIVELFDAQFLERPNTKTQETGKGQGESLARFGNAMLPVNYSTRTHTSPLFWYPYDRSREALATLSQSEAPDRAHGWKLQYVNPATGGYPMPTIATFLQLMPKGFQGEAYRSTDATAFCVMEGSGSFSCGGQSFRYGPKDVFVAPAWAWYEIKTDAESVIFSFSDRPVQQALDLWREERAA